MNIISVKESKDSLIMVTEGGFEWHVPKDESNSTYRLILDWVSEGNEIAPEFTKTEIENIKKEEVAKKRIDIINRINSNAQKYVYIAAGIIDSNGSVLTPSFEVDTWGIQADEAIAWESNNSSPTPSIDSIYNNRGLNSDIITLDGFRQKVYEKSMAYKAMIFHITGQRQKYEDMLRYTPDESLDNFPEPVYGIEV